MDDELTVFKIRSWWGHNSIKLANAVPDFYEHIKQLHILAQMWADRSDEARVAPDLLVACEEALILLGCWTPGSMGCNNCDESNECINADAVAFRRLTAAIAKARGKS